MFGRLRTTAREVKVLENINHFLVYKCVKFCFVSAVSVAAPRNGLNFLKSRANGAKNFGSKGWKEALRKFGNHS